MKNSNFSKNAPILKFELSSICMRKFFFVFDNYL